MTSYALISKHLIQWRGKIKGQNQRIKQSGNEITMHGVVDGWVKIIGS